MSVIWLSMCPNQAAFPAAIRPVQMVWFEPMSHALLLLVETLLCRDCCTPCRPADPGYQAHSQPGPQSNQPHKAEQQHQQQQVWCEGCISLQYSTSLS